MLNSSEIMTVVVDNKTYPLTAPSNNPILFTGSAPIATSNGYRYAKINRDGNTSTIESFMRPPVNTSTPNEFFSRSWNQRQVAALPVLYQPIDPIDRVKSDLHIDGQIPTFHIQGNQTEFDSMHHNTSQDLHLMSNVTYISLNDTLFYHNVEVSLAGRSSLMFPKLSYNLKLDKDDDLYHYRRIKLRALASDPSYIREQIAYDIIRSVGLASSGFSFCRLFLNDQELGLFGVMETFQDPWLANEFNDGKSYTDGRLYQGVTGNNTSLKQGLISDLSFVDNETAYAQGQYKIKEDGSKKDDYKPLMDLTEFLNVKAPMNGSDVEKKWNKQWNTESFLRS
jgi:spore coat protein CotH